MSERETIERLRGEILRRVVEAAKKGLTDEVGTLANLAKNCDAALEMKKGLDAEVERIGEELKSMDQPRPAVLSAPILRSPAGALKEHSRKAGSRQRGREKREKWVMTAMRNPGVRLRRLGEITYETASGKRVGIPYASEAAQRTYPWWLGLPDEQPHFVVLLCETETGELIDFVLDHRCVSQVWGSLSRDTNHHVKFHVRRSGPSWELKLKDGPLVQLNEYHRPGAANILR